MKAQSAAIGHSCLPQSEDFADSASGGGVALFHLVLVGAVRGEARDCRRVVRPCRTPGPRQLEEFIASNGHPQLQ